MKRRRVVVFCVVALFLLVGGGYLYRYWYDNEHFVRTDNAYLSGSLVQVSSPHAGRVNSIAVEVGQQVEEGMAVARMMAPVTANLPGSNASTVRYYEAGNLTSEVTAPFGGLVVSKSASVGETLAAGQSIVTLVDPAALWVVANVDENRVGRVKPGQEVEVHVDMLGRSLPGKVESITPAAAALFSFMPADNSTGNFTKVSQVVPVRIGIDYRGYTMYPGTSVSVSIRVKESS